MNRKLTFISLLLILLPLAFSCSDKYQYKTVEGDPMNTRIYTLDNGLTVYLSENKETPRIQTYIAVRVGGKNDPAETTGLAHYFEHLMFKGSEQFGTQDYAKEKPLLDEIERLFEVYRKTTDPAERKALYAKIDSVSYEASKYSIPNEYDKLMASIGAEGTNAYTSFDQTVFVEDIPANQVENWAKIQADRFQHNVIRGFHTELEAVYEEKNISLTKDNRKLFNTLLSTLFPDHPYGTQTVLGTQEDLKNPSITNIKNYYKTWYVPNNIAICMSGDFDSDEVIKIIDKYFGMMQPNYDLPKLPVTHENPIKEPVVKEVFGNDAENVALGWRLPGANSKERDLFSLTSAILDNGKSGIMDVDLLQTQKVLYAYSSASELADYSIFVVAGAPKGGQTLDEVKDLLLAEVEKLKKGEFDESLLKATINNFKLHYAEALESNEDRADSYVNAFVYNIDWAEEVNELDRLSKITKEDIVKFANEYLGNNYALIYKRQGKDMNEKVIEKPQITPIIMNRDSASQFLKDIQATEVKEIEPVFIDFNKDMQKVDVKAGLPMLYKENVTNDLFSLTYIFEMGNNNDKALSTAFSYLDYLGTSKLSLKDINGKFYELACDFSVGAGNERTYVTLSGLNENMAEAMEILEGLLADAQVNPEAYNNFVADILKSRHDAKQNKQRIFNQLRQFGLWGSDSPAKNILSEKELKEMNPQELVDRIHNLNNFPHRILYYGPAKANEVVATINEHHKTPEKFAEIPAAKKFTRQITTENVIYIAPYEANQIDLMATSNRGEKYDVKNQPVLNLYNNYFGGGMNSIVFQELRESRGLAYSTYAGMSSPSKLEDPYYYMAYIGTQNDKMIDAVTAFENIINNMPESEKAFNLAKEGIISVLRSERITKENILWDYIALQDLGLDYDTRKNTFDEVQKLTLQDVKKFQEEWVKDRKYTICIVGNTKTLDIEGLKKFAPVKFVTLEEIFGY